MVRHQKLPGASILFETASKKITVTNKFALDHNEVVATDAQHVLYGRISLRAWSWSKSQVDRKSQFAYHSMPLMGQITIIFFKYESVYRKKFDLLRPNGSALSITDDTFSSFRVANFRLDPFVLKAKFPSCIRHYFQCRL